MRKKTVLHAIQLCSR